MLTLTTFYFEILFNISYLYCEFCNFILYSLCFALFLLIVLTFAYSFSDGPQCG
ncbi:hypothetical protein HanIR_Chr11g0519481 [Helianthus annuus]|nr:hypothetical protein HanIR_Chr11g0519481 [Helianthus annuus]